MLCPATKAERDADAEEASGFDAIVVDVAEAAAAAEQVIGATAELVDVPPDSLFALGSGTDESTTKTIAETPRQYLSHMERNLG